MMDVLHKVFKADGDEWVADSSMILASNPPQYNCYRLRDRKLKYFYCHEIGSLKEVFWMTTGELYNFLHPNLTINNGISSITVSSNGGGTLIFHNSSNLTLELLTHKYLYHEMDRPQISNIEYDLLKVQWQKSTGQNTPCYGFSQSHPLAPRAATDGKARLGISN